MVMNLLEIPHAADLPTSVPEGDYTLELQRISKAYSRDAQAPGIKCSLATLADESPDGMPVDVLKWCSLEAERVWVLAQSLDFLDALGIERQQLQANSSGAMSDEELNAYLATFQGAQVRCHLTVREYEGRSVNDVQSVVA